MKTATTICAAAIAAIAGGCTTENQGYGPYYGPSQGYVYPQGYHAPQSYYAPPPYGYRAPYGQPYGGAGPGPSITFSITQ